MNTSDLTADLATDLARRITRDDLYSRAWPKRDQDGTWYVLVTLASSRQFKVASWDDWERRSER